jgi:O-antigen/teichoic acid export membrane protein
MPTRRTPLPQSRLRRHADAAVGLLRDRGLRGILVRGTLGSGGVMVANRVLALALSLTLARVLGTESYGVYASMVSVLTLLSVVASLGLPTLAVREMAASLAGCAWTELAGLLGWSARVALAAALILAGAVVALVPPTLFGWPPGRGLSWLLLLLVPLSVMGSLQTGALQGLGRVVWAQVPLLAVQPALVVAAVLGWSWVAPPGPDLWQTLVLYAAGLALAATLLAFGLRRALPAAVATVRPAYRRQVWARAAVPIWLSDGLFCLFGTLDVMVAAAVLEPAQTGVYYAAARVPMLLVFGIGAANTVLQPTIARLWAAQDRRRLERAASGAARLGLAVAAPLLLPILAFPAGLLAWFGPGFGAGATAMAVLGIGQALNVALGSPGLVLVMSGHERDAFYAILAVVVLHLGASLALTQALGIVGTALAYSLSVVAWKLILVWRVRQRLGLDPTVFGGRLWGLARSAAGQI